MKENRNTRFTKSYYKISEAADFIGVPQSTLRFWEKEFPQLNPRRSAHNQRYYSPEDLEFLQIINYLVKVKGLKLEAAKYQLKHNKNNISNKIKLIDKLEEMRGELEILLHSLNLRAQKIGI